MVFFGAAAPDTGNGRPCWKKQHVIPGDAIIAENPYQLIGHMPLILEVRF